MNQKNEWGGAKIPSILVKTPKGVAKLNQGNKEIVDHEENGKWFLEEALKRGRKRLDYVADESETTPEEEEYIGASDIEECNPSKRMRGPDILEQKGETILTSKTKVSPKKKDLKTFKDIKQKDRTFQDIREVFKKMETKVSVSKSPKATSQRITKTPERDKQIGAKPTPVKERIKRIEKLTLSGNSPKGPRKKNVKAKNHPGLDQGKIDMYFHKISKINNVKGARNGSLLGVSSCSVPPITSPEDTGPSTVECGRLGESEGKKKVRRTLEKWPTLKAKMESSSGQGSGERKVAGRIESPRMKKKVKRL